MFVCPACQTENRPTAKFCRKCGLRRQGSDDSAVAVAPPAERAVGQVEMGQSATIAAAGQEAGQPASASAAAAVCETPVAADDAAQAESEEDFGEEITEEEVQKELEGKRAGESTPAEAAQEAPRADQVAPTGAPALQGQQDSPGEQAEQPRRGGHTCPSCGSNVRVTDKFCIWCGERQPQRIIPKMKRCSECRTQLPMTANFCFVCGNDVSLHLRRKVRVPSELFHEEDPELFPTFEA